MGLQLHCLLLACSSFPPCYCVEPAVLRKPRPRRTDMPTLTSLGSYAFAMIADYTVQIGAGTPNRCLHQLEQEPAPTSSHYWRQCEFGGYLGNRGTRASRVDLVRL